MKTGKQGLDMLYCIVLYSYTSVAGIK